MSVIIWGNKEDLENMEHVRSGLLKLQEQKAFCSSEICLLTGVFESYYEREFAEAKLLFVYFSNAGEDFCRFLITHRRYTEKTVFLFGQSYGCFDSGKISNYYRVPKECYIHVSEPKDYFFESGLKQLLVLIQKKNCENLYLQAG